MIPRSLEVLKYIRSQFTPAELDKYGNIVGSVNSKGWTNNYDSFYTEKLPNAYDTEPGDPAPEYYVNGYSVDGAPLWNQNPKYVPVTNQSGKIVFLLALQTNSLEEPPIGRLVPRPPPPPVRTYTVETTPDPVFPTGSILSRITSSDPNDGSVLYWKYSGTGLTPAYFTNRAIAGIVQLVSGSSNIVSTVAWPVPAPLTLTVGVYSDPSFSKLVARTKVSIQQSSYSLSVSPGTVAPGETFTSTVTKENVPSGSTLYYRYTNVPAAYIVEGLEGSFIVDQTGGSFTSTVSNTIPSDDTLTISLYQDAERTQQVGNTVTVNITGTVSYLLTTYPTSVSETKQVVNTVATTNLDNEDIIYWKYESTVDLAPYFLGNEIEGQATITSNQAIWSSITAALLPGDATVTVKIFSDLDRTVQVGNETTFDITKTLLPTYDLQSNPKVLHANDVLTNQVSTENVGDTTLYWQYWGDDLTPSFFTDGKLEGEVTVTNNSGQWKSTLVDPVPADDSMTISLYKDSSRSKVLSSQSVTLQRTLVPTYTLSVNPATVSDGKNFAPLVVTTDVPDKTTLYWDYTADGLSGAWFADGITSGTVVINSNSGTWSGKTSNPVPSGIIVSINLYTDLDRTNKIASTPLDIQKDPVITYTWSATPTQLTEGSVFTFTITADTAPTIDEIFYYELFDITSDYLDPTSPGILGTFTFPANQTSYQTPGFKIANTLPSPETVTMQAGLYNDASRTRQVNKILNLTITPTPKPTYSVDTVPSPALAGQTITSTVSTVNVPQGTTLYWLYSGDGIGPDFFKDGLTGGSIIIGSDGTGSWSSSLRDPIPASTLLFVDIYADSAYQDFLARKVIRLNNSIPTYSLFSEPTTVTSGNILTNTVRTTNLVDNTAIYWRYAYGGGQAKSSYFEDGKLFGSVQIKDGSASWTSQVKAGVADPDTSIAVQIFSDSQRLNEVGNQQIVNLIFNPVPSGYYLTTTYPITPPEESVDFTLHLPAPATEDTTFYWSLEGLNDGAPMFNSSALSGDLRVQTGGTTAKLNKTVLADLPYGEIGHLRFSLNEDGSSPVIMPQVVNISATPLDPGIYFDSLGITSNSGLSVTVYDPTRANQQIYWFVSGPGVNTGVMDPLQGTTVLQGEGFGIVTLTSTQPTGLINANIKFYLDASLSTPLYSTSGYNFFLTNSPGNSPDLRSESSLDDYYDLGGYWEEVDGVPGPNNVGTNPDINMGLVMEASSDVDTLVLRARANYNLNAILYSIDSLGNNDHGAFCINTELGGGWAFDTGNEWGQGADPASAGKAKNSLYHAKNTFKPNRLIVSIGGDENEGNTEIYQNGVLAGGFDYAVGVPARAEISANQAASLVKNCGADGLEINMWIGKNETLNNIGGYDVFFAKLRDVLGQLDPTYTLHLALNARVDEDTPATSNQADFAGQLHQYFDSITIKNYNNPSKYGQVENDFGTPAASDFYHPSNLAWAMREAKFYLEAGVPMDKIGLTVSGTAAEASTDPANPVYTTYNRVLRGINGTNTRYDGPLGRYFGGVTPVGGSPTGGYWGFDSPSVVSLKAQTAINLGMSHISLWNFSGDYYDTNDTSLAVVASAARSHNGLVSATRKALSANTYGTSVIINNVPFSVRENEILKLEAYLGSGFAGGKMFWFQFEELDATLGQWKAISSDYFVDGVTKGFFKLDGTGRWSQNYTTAAGPFPTESLDVRVALYDSEPPSTVPNTTKPISSSEFELVKTPDITVTVDCAPLANNDGGEFTTTFTATNLQPGDPIWWTLYGPDVTPDFFVGREVKGVVYLDEALTATLKTEIAPVVPTSAYVNVGAALTDIAGPIGVGRVNIYKITPGVPEAGWTVNKPWVSASSGLKFYIKGKPLTTYYWKITGINSSDFFVGGPNLDSSSETDGTGVATISLTTLPSLGYGGMYVAYLYEDAEKTKPASPPLSGTILQSWDSVEPYVIASPAAANVNQTITYTIYDPSANNGTTVFVQATGDAVDNFIISSDKSATLTFQNNFAVWELETVSDFLSLKRFYELKIDVYTQEGGSPYKNFTTQYVFLHEAATVDKPSTGSYVFMRDWWDNGENPNFPDHPPANQAQIKQFGFPQIDELYFVGEVRPSDEGLLYHCPTADYVPENLILNGDGTDWGTQVISETTGPWPLKFNMESLNADPKPSFLVLSVGGPAGWGDDIPAAGASDETAEKLADQLFTLATLCEAKAIDLMYQPDPIVEYQTDNFVRVFSKLRNKVVLSNSSMKIYFTTHPIRGENETDKKILETANAIKSYVDRINVLTVEHYSQLGQDYWDEQGKAGGPIYAHTGIWQSTKDVSLFIEAGVPASKLGMAYAYYGHAAVVDTNFDQSYKSDYNDIAYIQGTGDFPLGRYTTTINEVEYPVSFDSTSTIAQKVQALRNMGVSHIFGSEITKDYFASNLLDPGGNSRVALALTRAARIATQGFENPISP